MRQIIPLYLVLLNEENICEIQLVTNLYSSNFKVNQKSRIFPKICRVLLQGIYPRIFPLWYSSAKYTNLEKHITLGGSLDNIGEHKCVCVYKSVLFLSKISKKCFNIPVK